jgi:hypothetical protein
MDDVPRAREHPRVDRLPDGPATAVHDGCYLGRAHGPNQGCLQLRRISRIRAPDRGESYSGSGMQQQLKGIDSEVPLLLVHRRKLIVGSTVLAASAVVALFPETVGRLLGVSTLVSGLGGAIVFVVVLYWLAQGLKCPGCGINLFWYGLGHAKSGNWLDWLLKQSTCPKCGYRSVHESASRRNQRL